MRFDYIGLEPIGLNWSEVTCNEWDWIGLTDNDLNIAELNWNWNCIESKCVKLTWTWKHLVDVNGVVLNLPGLNELDLVWLDLYGTGLNWMELHWVELDWIVWIGMAWLGLDWTGVVSIGLNWIEWVWIGINLSWTTWIMLGCIGLNWSGVELDRVGFELIRFRINCNWNYLNLLALNGL